MEKLWDILLVVLPSLVVAGTAFYVMRHFLADEQNKRMIALKVDDRKATLPLRLQAYERCVLFLERITPGNMVLRLHKSNMTARSLHAELVSTVREEFEHNLAQQIYVSDDAWNAMLTAKEETIRLFNLALQQTGDAKAGTELSRKVFELSAQLTRLPSHEATQQIKKEVRHLF